MTAEVLWLMVPKGFDALQEALASLSRIEAGGGKDVP